MYSGKIAVPPSGGGIVFFLLTIKIGLHLLHKVCGNQAANANLTLKNSARNQDRAYFLLYTTLIYANLRTTVEKNKITRLKR
jgi:hypothetical protein